MIPSYFIYVGAILSLSGSLNYAINTLKGKTKPNRVTWFLWALAPLIAFAAQISQGVGLVSLMTFMVGFGPLLIFIASFFNKNSAWKLTKFDIVCGSLSLLGLVIWFFTREANYAIAIAIIADLLAALPTIVKSYKYPETESHLVFLFASINALIALLVIENWGFEYYAFPLYILLLCLPLFFMIKFKLGPKISSIYETK
jgi:hypothetical protein